MNSIAGATIAGYNGTTLYAHTGTANYKANSTQLYYTMDTFEGQSGGPVFYKQGNEYWVVGIHTTGGNTYNYARLVDGDVTSLFLKASLLYNRL